MGHELNPLSQRHMRYTTQIEHYDNMGAIFASWACFSFFFSGGDVSSVRNPLLAND